MGLSIHAGMVVVADGTPEAAARLRRVLTNDPGTGVMRHADAGYEDALALRARARPQDPGRDLVSGGAAAPRDCDLLVVGAGEVWSPAPAAAGGARA